VGRGSLEAWLARLGLAAVVTTPARGELQARPALPHPTRGRLLGCCWCGAARWPPSTPVSFAVSWYIAGAKTMRQKRIRQRACEQRDKSGLASAHAWAARGRAAGARRRPHARPRAPASARAARRRMGARGRAQALWARATQAGALREEAEAARAAGQQAALATTREQLEQWDLLMGNSARLEAENRRLRRAPAPGATSELCGASRSSACRAPPRRRSHAHMCGGEVCPGLLGFKYIRQC